MGPRRASYSAIWSVVLLSGHSVISGSLKPWGALRKDSVVVWTHYAVAQHERRNRARHNGRNDMAQTLFSRFRSPSLCDVEQYVGRHQTLSGWGYYDAAGEYNKRTLIPEREAARPGVGNVIP